MYFRPKTLKAEMSKEYFRQMVDLFVKLNLRANDEVQNWKIWTAFFLEKKIDDDIRFEKP